MTPTLTMVWLTRYQFFLVLQLLFFSTNLYSYRIIESVDEVSSLDSSLQNYYSFKTRGPRDLSLVIIPDQIIPKIKNQIKIEDNPLDALTDLTKNENGRGKILIMRDQHNGVIPNRVLKLQKYCLRIMLEKKKMPRTCDHRIIHNWNIRDLFHEIKKSDKIMKSIHFWNFFNFLYFVFTLQFEADSQSSVYKWSRRV